MGATEGSEEGLGAYFVPTFRVLGRQLGESCLTARVPVEGANGGTWVPMVPVASERVVHKGTTATAEVGAECSSFVVGDNARVVGVVTTLVCRRIPFEIRIPGDFTEPGGSDAVTLAPLTVFPFPGCLTAT